MVLDHTDINTLIVTETNYTPRILTDLNRAGYDISDINVGDAIPQAFVNRLIDENKGFLLLARDEKGARSWSCTTNTPCSLQPATAIKPEQTIRIIFCW